MSKQNGVRERDSGGHPGWSGEEIINTIFIPLFSPQISQQDVPWRAVACHHCIDADLLQITTAARFGQLSYELQRPLAVSASTVLCSTGPIILALVSYLLSQQITSNTHSVCIAWCKALVLEVLHPSMS